MHVVQPFRVTAAAATALLSLTLTVAPAQATMSPGHGNKGIGLAFLGRFSTGSVGTGASEITSYDPATRQVFVVNAQAGTVDVLDIRDPRRPRRVTSLAAPGANSVAVGKGLVAVAQQAESKTGQGRVTLFQARSGKKLREFRVGALPDMVTFTEDGRRLVVANEGEPASYCAGAVDDPEGSVSVIDVARGTVRTAGFRAFNGQAGKLRAAGVRLSGPEATVARDLEPEYVTVAGDTAWVTLQENNAVAIVDLDRAEVERIVPLGLKDFGEVGVDASDKDGKIDIRPRPGVKGMYMPDGVANFRSRGQTYLVTANEGDGREWDCHADEVRVKELTLSAGAFAGAAELKKDTELGRLTVAADSPKDASGAYTELYAFGGRSISVRSATGALVWDSGDELERLIARELPEEFNADNEENDSFDSRSDNKGPEPEGVTVGEVRGRTYAFAGLERVSGVVAYDVTDPRRPALAGYLSTRDFAGSLEQGTAGDVGPEGVLFVPAEDSPTRRPLLIVGNEVSGTTAVYEVR
ncbi:choice-of-anchor I family protein [Sphaerisporangium sp. TRM90804]|uniref:choice-of-anchor I family protein n=1 Tax=Sphaerisporangium sp. TRM90804 TaxID=3031113 RepID=UPI00244C3ECF|nr:choice-of-anchor I family protein [Sphaerisporangium sp. TRM90804]MDH2426846.1 choice-of-anchor I family protein [Sphaerisporangium sp. TRM90804]